jgi:hypothetical protein
MENESIVLGNCPTKTKILDNLKTIFLGNTPGNTDDFAPVIVFVAWIFRYTRDWIYQKDKGLIDGRKIVYQVNFGKPSSQASWDYDDKYIKIVNSAWELSQLEDTDFTLKTAKEFYRGNFHFNNLRLDQLSLIPEFAAHITGYMQSPQYQNDPHMVFDVGAGTIDVAFFSLFKTQNDQVDVAILASDVKPLGTQFLERAQTDKRETNFISEVSQILISNFFKAKEKVDFENYPKWDEKLRTFKSGGGARIQSYEKALNQFFDSDVVKLKLNDMKDQSQYFDKVTRADKVELSENSHRLSVAYGLTFDNSLVVSRVVPPNKIPSSNKPKNNPISQLDRDDLYPK